MAPIVAPAPVAVKTEAPSTVAGGVETYGSAKPKPAAVAAAANEAPIHTPTPAPAPQKEVEEEDDLSVPVPEGAKCKRLGCGADWKGEAVSRGDGPEAVCHYHPMAVSMDNCARGHGARSFVLTPPSPSSTRVPRATSAASAACSSLTSSSTLPAARTAATSLSVPRRTRPRRSASTAVSTTTRHLFRSTSALMPRGELIEESEDSATDRCSCDKEKSKVTFETQLVHLDLHLPGNKRVVKDLTLYGPIDPEKSAYRILGTKVDITLQKPAAASWPVLELPPVGSELPPGYALTFGVSGRTGTVGGKEIVLSAEEMAKHNK